MPWQLGFPGRVPAALGFYPPNLHAGGRHAQGRISANPHPKSVPLLAGRAPARAARGRAAGAACGGLLGSAVKGRSCQGCWRNPELKDKAWFLLKGHGRPEMLHLWAARVSGAINKQAVSQLSKYSAARVASVLPVPSEWLDAQMRVYFFLSGQAMTKRNLPGKGQQKTEALG